jgi:hypothetical protein
MNEHESSYSKKEVLNLSLKAAHAVTRHDPLQAYRDMGRPLMPDLQISFGSYANRVADLDQQERHELGHLLTNGFNATGTILTKTLLDSPHVIRKKEALEIARSDDTVHTLSVVALQNANTALELVERAKSPYSPFVVHRPSQSIRFIHPNYQSINPGPNVCTGALLKDGETISPVFRDFVRWSGAVAVHCMYKRRFTNSGG